MTSVKLEHSAGDYIRVKLLANLGSDELEKTNYKNAIDYLLEYFTIVKRNSFHDLKSLDGPCYFNLALSYSKIGNFENSVHYLSKFLEGNHNDYSVYFESKDAALFDAYFERFMSYIKLKKWKEANEDISKAIDINPSRADLFVNKGICCIELFNKQEALKAFKTAKSLWNKDAESYFKFCLPSKDQLEELSFSSFSDLLKKNNEQVKIVEIAAEVYYLINYLIFRKNKILTNSMPFLNEMFVKLSISDLTESDLKEVVVSSAKKMFENDWEVIKDILFFQFEMGDNDSNLQVRKNDIELYFKERHKI